ncbi:MAG: hypothetical protein KA713_16685 [Chryseotalea sp. WA131a]|jgi:hypothetical protein|nr:MAG: hypothetical protein KA713_16685 [Chryseotalea sp. WA131a]
MKTLEIDKIEFKSLNDAELADTTGGGWFLPFLAGYLAGEILEGIQRGISKPCSEVRCC